MLHRRTQKRREVQKITVAQEVDVLKRHTLLMHCSISLSKEASEPSCSSPGVHLSHRVYSLHLSTVTGVQISRTKYFSVFQSDLCVTLKWKQTTFAPECFQIANVRYVLQSWHN